MNDEATPRAVAQWEVPLCWHRLAELLLPVMRRGEVDNSLEDVRQFLCAGNMQAWHIGWQTVFITQIQPFGWNAQAPTRRVCAVIYCAGQDLERWLPCAETHFTAWGRAMGCSRLRITGRRGWLRVLPHWNESSTTLERDL